MKHATPCTCTFDFAYNPPKLKNYDCGETLMFQADVPSPPAPDMVNHPPHYAGMPGIDFECIELTRWLSFDVGNACKYVWRADRKNGLEDLRKALWYIKDARTNTGTMINMFDLFKATTALLKIIGCDEIGTQKRLFFEAIRCNQLLAAELALEAMIEQAS